LSRSASQSVSRAASRSRPTTAAIADDAASTSPTPLEEESPKPAPGPTASGILKNNKDESKLREIPSSWSTRRFNIDYHHPFAEFIQVANPAASSTDSQICLTCQALKKSPILSSKTAAERALFTKLCEEALKNRRDALTFYSSIYDQELRDSQARLSSFNPETQQLGAFMLRLVTERQELLKDRHPKLVLGSQVHTNKSMSSLLQIKYQYSTV
jgi:hypothetical protein